MTEFVRLNSAADIDKRIEAEKRVEGGVEYYRLKSAPGDYETLVLDISPTEFYVGKAVPGALTSAPVWQIRKFTKVGGLFRSFFADGNGEFDNVWDDVLTLSYP